VLSPPIFEILSEKLHIKFSDHLAQKYILGYVLHGQNQTIKLDEVYGASYALRRITFDDYMMRQALQHGARLNLAEVMQVERTGTTFKLTTTKGIYEADFWSERSVWIKPPPACLSGDFGIANPNICIRLSPNGIPHRSFYGSSDFGFMLFCRCCRKWNSAL